MTKHKRFKRICTWCGGTYETGSHRSRYCRPACKQAAFRGRNQEKDKSRRV